MPSFDEEQRRIAARKQAEMRRALADKRTEVDGTRAMCTIFASWRRCRRLDCRRHHACCGDPLACFARYWGGYPRPYLQWITAAAQAREIGHAMQDAMRIADETAREGSGCVELPGVRTYLQGFDELHMPAGGAATTGARGAAKP
jgi:hypothetical protein